METRYCITTLLPSLNSVVSLSILDRSASVREDRWQPFVATFVSISFNFALRIPRRLFSPSECDARRAVRLTTCWQRERRAARRPGLFVVTERDIKRACARVYVHKTRLCRRVRR